MKSLSIRGSRKESLRGSKKASLRSNRKASLKILLIACLLVSTFFGNAATSSVYADPDPTRVPINPFPSPEVDDELTKRDLTYADSPLDNPLKGFAPFYPWETETSFPHSLEWYYIPLKAVMNGPESFTFDTGLEPALNEIAARGNQAAIRVYLEYPDKPDAIPAFIRDNDDIEMRYNATFNQDEPNYDHPLMVEYLTNFIEAFGAKYDGDPRIGFIHMGLVGLWGEWHTWPYDEDDGDGLPNHMPSDETIGTLFTAYDAAFNKTKLEVRYPGLPGASEFNFGYHDDSFGFKEGNPLQSVTQPESMGGAYYSFLTKMLDAGSENKWITQSIGGEVRPEIQGSFFSGGANVDNAMDDIELTHATWMINHRGISEYSASNAAVAAGVRKMGYDLQVKSSFYNNIEQGDSLKVGVTIENNGVAPFSYPWMVEVGVKDVTGKLVKQWETTWDLTKVMPMEIRTYPEWGLLEDQKYVPFGEPYYFDTTIPDPDLNDGYYYLVMKVVNPLEAISSKAKQVRFANTNQDPAGWLNLGPVLIGECASPCTTPPTAPPPPPEPPKRLLVDDFDGTPAWSDTKSNDLGERISSSNFANGNGSGIVQDGALELQYQNSAWFETNIGRNLSETNKLVLRMKGAVGGEESDINLQMGGVMKTLQAFSGDTVTTSYKDIVIDLTKHSEIDLTVPIWAIAISLTWGKTGTIYIDEIYFTDKYGSDPDPGTDPGTGMPGLIEDFESYADNAALRQAWTEAWSDKPGSVTRALGDSSGSKGLELSVAIADSEWANIIHAIPADLQDWSKFDGLSFWVNNATTTSEGKDFSLNVALQTPVAKGEFGLKEGGAALTITEGGVWQAAAFNGSSLNVPKGFKGVVRIPWDQFVQAAWQCGNVQADCTATLDPGTVTGLQFGYPPIDYVNNVITIDDIALYRADKTLDDFEAYADDAALQNVWRIDWENGTPSARRTLDLEHVASGEQAMKFTVTPPPVGSISEWVNIKRAAFTGTDSNWSAFDGLTFWANNTSPTGKGMDLNISLVTDASKGEFSIKEGGAVQFYDAEEGWKASSLGGGSLSVAAGYKGMVRIPWSAFSQATWQGCGACDLAFDASKVLQIQFGFNPSAQADNVFSIDQVGIYALAGRTAGSGGGSETPPVDRPAAPEWATAAGTRALVYQPAPVDNPLKGLLPFYDASEEAYFKVGDDWRDRPTQLPYSLEFFYLPLSKLMNNIDDFNWTELDKRLAEVASRGNQAVFRVYLDYPNKPSGIPQFLIDAGLQTYEYEEFDNGKDATSLAPNYNDELLLNALDNFIGAMGERYDGDPRVGSIMIGLIGFWGEWHTYPYDGNIKQPNLMPTDANLKRVLTSIDNAFNQTQLVLRYPKESADLKTKEFDVGYHDDSFAFQTLPPSLGGQGWHFWGRVNDAGVTQFWKQNMMGGEMRPEIQVKMWNNDPPRYYEPSTPIENAQGEDYYTSLNLTHASWLIAQGIFQTPLAAEPLARAAEGSRRMGYEYYAPAAYLEGSGGDLKVGVELENRGVAPFYYDWKVELAAQTETGIVRIWDPGWNLSDILPSTNGFDGNKLFESTTNPELGNGSYQILMRYVNPLEDVNADAKKFRFANAEQNNDGWLTLGSVDVSDSVAEASVRVTGLTTNTPSAIQLEPGESKQAEVAVAPAEASNDRVVWTSSDLKVAYVSGSGKITAVGVGRTIITARSSDGNLQQQFTVKVGSDSEPNQPSDGTSTGPGGSAPDITDKGIKLGQDASKLARSINEYGVNVTTATVDAKKLEDAIRALKNNSNAGQSNAVIIELKNDVGSVKVDIPSSALTDGAKELPDLAIIVQTDFGSYTVPVDVLELDALAEQMGISLNEMTISIVIDKVAGSTSDLLTEQARKEGLTLLSPGLDYKIMAAANGKSTEIGGFGSTYIERTINLTGTPNAIQTTALLFDPATGTFHFVPSILRTSEGRTEALIKRNGNSIYAVVKGSKTFADLKGHWAQSDIELLASKRVVHGVSAASFAPNASITRAEFAAILVRSLGLSASTNMTADFSDVAQDDWFADAVATAVQAGLIEGYGDGTFRPNVEITREQLAIMVSRALSYAGQTVQTDEGILGSYADNSSIATWAKASVAEMLAAGIIKGKSESTLAPVAQATRAEAAVMIKRFLQFVQFMN